MIRSLSTSGARGRRLVAVPVLLTLLLSLLPTTPLGAGPTLAVAAPTAPAVAAGETVALAGGTAPGNPGIVAAATPTLTAIAAGGYHTCSLHADGTVRCWGLNSDGQLGDGTTTRRLTPVRVSGITTATAIAAGARHTCAVLVDRTVRCWGKNNYGQLGDGTLVNSLTAVQVAGISTATAIAAGGGWGHSCALLADGSVRCWGNNTFGQLGDATWTNRRTPVPVHDIAAATAIAVGDDHSCALLANGTAECWGYNGAGQLGGLGDDTWTSSNTPVAVGGIATGLAITAGDNHTCAVLANRVIRCWGSNSEGQLGDGTSDSERHLTPVAVQGITTVAAIAAGFRDTCALLINGTVGCWGHNGEGQLGDGTTTRRLTPVRVSGITTATAISIGWRQTCARVADGSARCWGNNTFGQLGDGTTTDRHTPVTVVFSVDTTPPTATLAGPASPTNAATLSYAVTFSEPVTGLAASDFTRTGTAAGCTVGTPSGSGATYTVSVTGCGKGTVVFALRANTVADLAGNNGPAATVTAATVTIDRTAPSVSAPAATLRTGVSLSGSAIPARLAWSGSDTGGSGIARYELARSTNGGTIWTTISSSLMPPSTDVTVPASGTVRYRVRAVDRAGNTGSWATGPVLTPRLVQQSSTAVKYAGTWTTVSSSAYSGGSAKYAKVAGPSATYTFTGRSIALVTTKAPTSGKVKVYVNGTYVATIDLYATTTTYRVLAWQKTWSTSGTRTVKLVVAGTWGRPRVDLDAFALLK